MTRFVNGLKQKVECLPEIVVKNIVLNWDEVIPLKIDNISCKEFRPAELLIVYFLLENHPQKISTQQLLLWMHKFGRCNQENGEDSLKVTVCNLRKKLKKRGVSLTLAGYHGRVGYSIDTILKYAANHLWKD